MFARYFLIICSIISISGCAKYHTAVNPPAKLPPQFASSVQHRQTPNFSRVYVNGAFDVNLHTGYKHSSVILHGDPRDLANVSTQVVNGVMRLTVWAGYPRYGKLSAEINTHNLTSFVYRGTGTITGYKINTGYIDVFLDNSGRTMLQGNISLRKLEVTGGGYTEILGVNSPYLLVKISGKSNVKISGAANLSLLDINDSKGQGRFSFYWVKSNELRVRGSGKAYIQLAGIANKLNVELWDNARFNGRYLRADRAFVKTHNKSVAEISAVKRQHTLASDDSDIQFYNIPNMKADFMAYNGAVLDMRDLSPPVVQEYDQYNK